MQVIVWSARSNTGVIALVAAGTGAVAGCNACGQNRPEAREQAAKPAPGPSHTVRWQQPIEVATGDAYAGPWRMNESEFHYVDDATVALTAGGDVVVAWVDNRARDVRLQRYDASGRPVIEAPVDVSRSPKVFSWLPDVVVSDDGEQVFVLWQEIVFSGGTHGGEAFFARSTDGGRSFEPPLNLSESKAGDGKGRLTRELWHNGSLDLARDEAGTLYAAWTAYEGGLWLGRSTDGGRSFGEPLRVAGTAQAPARAPDLAVGPDGEVYLAWTLGESQTADIHLAVSTDRGASFGAARIPFGSSGHSDTPRIAIDRKGDLHLVYAESPAGMLGAYHILYARLEGGRRPAGNPIRIAGPGSGGIVSARFPSVSIGANNGVFVLWNRYPEDRRRPRGLGYAVSLDRGDTFTSPAVVPGTAAPGLGRTGGMQGMLNDKLTVTAAGAIAVANSRFDRGDASHVRLIRGQAAR